MGNESEAKQDWAQVLSDTVFEPRSEDLTDGSKVWSVLALDPTRGVVMDFKCVDDAHAAHLADVLSQCVAIDVDAAGILG